MSIDVRYWIWLQMCLGVGARFREIIDDFGSVEKLYSSNLIEWKMSTVLTSKQIENLQKYCLDDTQKIIDECNKNNWQIITYDDERYPNRLKEISNPPAILYVDGEMVDFDNYVTIGMVGTRKPSTYAVKVAHIMSKGVSLCGAIVVSGGALGVDSSAHKGALTIGAKTVAVLGCGFGTDYLEANRELREMIKQNGALITEYPPFTKASRTTFPMRNRIISGLSLGVLIVEAGVKSGSLITANFANEQNRDVFAIPASIFDYNFYGTNKLIEDGATVATNPSVLIEQYAERYDTLDMSKIKTARELFEDDLPKNANAPEPPQISFDNIKKDRAENVNRQKLSIELDGDEKSVYSSLSSSFESIDIIAERCSLDTKRVLVALTMLEMKALVETASGKRYRLK